MLINFFSRLSDPDTGGGGSGSGGTDDANITGSFQRRLERFNNDAMLMANELYRENYRERESNRRLREQVTELQGRIPADGATVLTAEQAALWTSYQALGQPTELQQRIDAGQTAITERDSLRRETTIRQAADATGYKPSVLAKLAGDIPVTVRDNNGQNEAVVTVDGKDVQLTVYAEQHWSDFLPALTAQSQQSQQQMGTPFVQQVGNGKHVPPVTAAQTYLQKTYKQKEAS